MPAPGAEYTDEPFRWDHKLFVVNVCLPSHPPQRIAQPPVQTTERKQIEAIVEKMNGKSFDFNSHKSTTTIIESILQRMQPNSVFIKFDRCESTSQNIQPTSNGGKNFGVYSFVMEVFLIKVLFFNGNFPSNKNALFSGNFFLVRSFRLIGKNSKFLRYLIKNNTFCLNLFKNLKYLVKTSIFYLLLFKKLAYLFLKKFKIKIIASSFTKILQNII